MRSIIRRMGRSVVPIGLKNKSLHQCSLMGAFLKIYLCVLRALALFHFVERCAVRPKTRWQKKLDYGKNITIPTPHNTASLPFPPLYN